MKLPIVPTALLALSFVTMSCSNTPPVKPTGSSVKVSRAAPPEDCKDLGSVNGRVKNISSPFEEALEDMKNDAARMGANYVQMGATGNLGQSITGRAFVCD